MFDKHIPNDQVIEPKKPGRVKHTKVNRKGQKAVPIGSPKRKDDQIVEKFLEGQTGPVTNEQISAMGKLLGRQPRTIRAMIVRARQKFVSKAERYVEIHAEATEDALNNGDNETAIKAAQWAMQNISSEGQRIVEKQESGPSGTKVLIGVQISGVSEPKTLVKQIAPTTPLEESSTEEVESQD